MVYIDYEVAFRLDTPEADQSPDVQEPTPPEYERLFAAEEAAKRTSWAGHQVLTFGIYNTTDPHQVELRNARQAVDKAHLEEHLRSNDLTLERTIVWHQGEWRALPVPAETQVGLLGRVGRALFDRYIGEDIRPAARANAALQVHMRHAGERLDAHRRLRSAQATLNSHRSLPVNGASVAQMELALTAAPTQVQTDTRVAQKQTFVGFATRTWGSVVRSFTFRDTTPSNYFDVDYAEQVRAELGEWI